MDFGVGKVHAPLPGADDLTVQSLGLTDTHAIVGTAGYMSPEQVANQPIDFRADQFALGVIMYEMLTGRRAFRRDTAVQTMAAILDAEPEPIGDQCPDAPIELITIVERCLAKNPANRYASTSDLARDLRDVGRAIASPTPRSSAPTKLHPSRLRTRWVVAPLAVLAAVAAIAFALLHRPAALEEARRLVHRYDQAANVDRAIALLEPLVAASPSDQAARVTLAEGYFRRWEIRRDDASITRAKEAARAAQNLNEQDAPTHVVWAMIDLGQGLIEGAVGEAQRAIALNGKSSEAWRELGRAYVRLARLDEAQKALLNAVKLGPDDWTAHNGWARSTIGTPPGRGRCRVSAHAQFSAK